MSLTITKLKAGLLQRSDRLLTPDTRRGCVQVLVDDEDLIHFQWLERESSVPDVDIIIFPGEAIFEKVNKASPSDLS